MPKAKAVRVNARRTSYLHGYLRMAAWHALNQADGPGDGEFYDCMHCILSSAFMIEAHLNFVGESKVKNWDAIERTASPTDKLLLVCRTIGLEIPKGGKLMHSFKRAFKFRNHVVHGRTRAETGSWIEAVEATKHRTPETDWEKLCTTKMARRVFDESVTLVRTIHEAAGLPKHSLDSIGHGSSTKTPI